MEKKSDNELFSVGATVEAAIGKSRQLKEGVLKAEWPKIVGRLANDSQPEYIKNRVLLITVETPVFLHYFTMNRKKYVDIVNDYFKSEVITDISIRTGVLNENRDEYMNCEDEVEEIFFEKPQEESKISSDDEQDISGDKNENYSVVKDGDMSASGIFKKIEYLKKIATEREKYLLSHGYKKCRSCGMIFQSDDQSEEFCKVCIEEKKDREFKRRGNY